MTEEGKLKQAKIVFETLCKAFDKNGWKYEKYEDKMLVKSGFTSEDFPVEFFIVVNAKSQVVSLVSPLPFKIEEDKRIDAAVAVSVANNKVIDGLFDYEIEDGSIRFRFASSFRDCVLGEGLFNFMVACAVKTIDNYNDKFFMLSKGMLTVEQFMQSEKENRK